jgi:hypothetical protein
MKMMLSQCQPASTAADEHESVNPCADNCPAAHQSRAVAVIPLQYGVSEPGRAFAA